MKIVHISAECYPAAKAGGLADVVGSLPKYQNIAGHESSVIMPHYYTKFRNDNLFEQLFQGSAKIGRHDYPFKVFKLLQNPIGFELFSIEIPGLFDRERIYSYHDDTERFITFQVAALNWMKEWEILPEIVHCHDQHTGFVPFMIANIYEYGRLKEIPTVFTIHNGQYQGQFGFDRMHYLPPFHSFFTGLIEWDKAINPLASAIKCAWEVTTVSPSYMDEIGESMNGLEPLLRAERGKSKGILNGIDVEVWNPATDAMLEKNYTLKTVESGKKANKKWLCDQFNLDTKKPLFTFIGRLVGEKGADLLPEVIYQTLSQHHDKLNVLILGSGERHIEQALWDLEPQFKGNYCSYIGYNEKLSHVIYAGADFLLMPSKVEPCGLNQLYALRYGTVPVVRRTGGLRDTVTDIGDQGFGICHDQCVTWDIKQAIERAMNLYEDVDEFKNIRKQIMQIDHSWNRAALEYIELYQTIKK